MPSSPAKLVAAAGLNVGFAVIQIVVGLAIGSVVVLADAGHQVVDAIGLITALAAMLLTRRPSSSRMSFGWGKADALGGFTSGLLLLASIGWIAIESLRRLADPVEVDGGSVIVIGLIAIAVNGVSVLMVDSDEHALSIEAARLHLLTDLAGSALVVLAGVVLSGTELLWVDPAASLLLCAVVMASTVGLLRRSVAELLDRAPRGLTGEQITHTLIERDEVLDVHHVHLRPLGNGDTSVTAHVVVNGERSVHEAQAEVDQLSALLASRLGVSHTTLQLECHPCGAHEHTSAAQNEA